MIIVRRTRHRSYGPTVTFRELFGKAFTEHSETSERRPRCLIGWINSASGLDWHNRLVGDGPKVLSVFRETASTRCSR